MAIHRLNDMMFILPLYNLLITAAMMMSTNKIILYIYIEIAMYTIV